MAEYQRLSDEMHKLATRNAWSGVERTFIQLQSTGVPLSVQDLLDGAHAARSRGDVTAAWKRLQQAKRLDTAIEEVNNWLGDIEANFGHVFIGADADKRYQLQPATMPFNPDHRKAVEYAQQQVEEKGVFEGLLPSGLYTFTNGKKKDPIANLNVQPQVASIRYDYRTIELEKKRAEK